ncbi:hypothetical protein VTI74DRAFT_1648 [Chaetomium olivicolor]
MPSWLGKLGHENPFEKVSIGESLNHLEQSFQGPIADRELVSNAQSAVLTLDEEQARIQAGHQVARLGEERRRVAGEERAKIHELHRQPRAKWVQEIVDAALPRWGFVIQWTAYSDDHDDGDDNSGSDAAWKRFQDYFEDTCRNVTLF